MKIQSLVRYTVMKPQYIAHIFPSVEEDGGMSDERARATVRMPEEAYDRLCAELPSFSTDTARFQYLMQFYFDYKDMGYTPRNQPDCNPEAHGPNAPARGEEHPPLQDYSSSEAESQSQSGSESQSESDTASDNTERSSRRVVTPTEAENEHGR